jgi:hypothetical protein
LDTRFKKRLAAFRQMWWTSSDLGIKLTLNGCACLVVALILNHFPMRLPLFWSSVHVVLHWGIWGVGVVLVIVGLARLMIVDIHAD